MIDFEQSARVIARELQAMGLGHALVGGFAVSVRAEPRFTRDLDLAVAVEDDGEAEDAVRTLLGRGYEVLASVEHDTADRLATVRLSTKSSGLVVDLLFASSGIECEVVAAADPIDVLPGLVLPVASVGHLIALKLLSRGEGRPQDDADLFALLAVATDDHLVEARAAARLITDRGFARGRDLEAALDELVS